MYSATTSEAYFLLRLSIILAGFVSGKDLKPEVNVLQSTSFIGSYPISTVSTTSQGSNGRYCFDARWASERML